MNSFLVSNTGSSSSATAFAAATSSGVEFIVPADEHFPRCPVSKEMFETFFDEDEGEMMFRNAAKVMNSHLFDDILDDFLHLLLHFIAGVGVYSICGGA